MQRKSMGIVLAALVMSSLVLAACSSGKATSSPTGSSDTPKRGGSLVIDVAQDPVTLDPSKEGGYEGNYMAINVRDRLTQLDDKGNIAPSLATSWDATPTQITFHLRTGVKFSNGAPFTSADVKYTFDTILSPKNAYAGNYAPFFKSVEAPDPNTFVVNFKQPYQYFLRQMAENSDFGIVPNHWLDTCGTTCDTTVIGTGPFKVAKWDKGQKLVLDRNPNYWDAKQPYLDKVTFQVVPDAQTQILQLRSNQTDMLLSVPTSSAASLKGQTGIDLLTHGGGQTNEVIFNTLVPPFNNEQVRQAMSYALDRKAIIDGGLFGYADVPTDLFPSYMEQHDSAAPAPITDTDKAKSLLAQAGYNDSHPLSFELRTINTSDFINQATVIKSQLSKLGVQVKVTPMEKGAFLAPMFRDEGSDPKSWQAGLERYSFTSDPQSFSWEQYAKGSAINASNINLPGGAQVPELEKVVNETLAAPDLAAAKTLFTQELGILKTAVPDVRISYQMNLQATTARVHGYQALSGNQFPLRLVWVS
jgi:peptide/nickel transport system substrate-binding protein